MKKKVINIKELECHRTLKHPREIPIIEIMLVNNVSNS